MRKQNAEEKLQLLNKLLQGIKTGLESVTIKLFAGKEEKFDGFQYFICMATVLSFRFIGVRTYKIKSLEE